MNNSILQKFPSNKRLFKSRDSEFDGWRADSCIFGISHHNNPLPSIDLIPSSTKCLYSYYAEGSLDILKHIIEVGINENLEHLILGFEHGNHRYGYKDYSDISKLLSTVNFPRLKTFEYGEDFLIANEQKFYPHLGNISEVLKKMPSLETLELSGSFEIGEKISLKELKNIFITDSYSEKANGVIQGKSLEYFLGSDFGNLREVEIALVSNENFVYDFNAEILKLNLHTLESLSVTGRFEKGTKEKILNILHLNVKNVDLSEMEEV